jgi:site-specific recombinase XerD
MQNDGAKSPFLNRVRDVIRTRHYSIRTEQSYVHWVKRFILFHGKRHPTELSETEVAAFLTHLAVNRQVSPSTQNQALNALVFLYRYVLERPLGDILDVVRCGKGGKDRVVTLPDPCIEPLKQQLALVRQLHSKDLQDGFGAVWLPHALARKYPRAPSEFAWQYG